MPSSGSSTMRDTPGDIDRLRAAARGDLLAFEMVARNRLPAAWRLSCAMLGKPAVAGDAVMDAMVAAWRELPRVGDLATFDTWLRRIVIDACRMELRRQGPLSGARDEGWRTPPDVVVDPELAHMVERAIRLDALEATFERLEPDERAVVALREVDGLATDSIAELLHLPPGTVDWHLRETRLRLERASSSIAAGGEQIHDLIAAMFRRRLGGPVPEALVDRILAVAAREPQARPGRGRPGGARRAAGRVALGLGLGGAAVLVVFVALTSGPLGGSGTGAPTAGGASADPAVGTPGTPGSAPVATSGDVMTPTELVPGALVVVTNEGAALRVRTRPSLSNDSLKLEPTLKAGTRLFIVGGPVREEPYDWYLAQVYRGAPSLFGWVASGKAGKAWIRPRPLACPAEPDEHALATMVPLEFLACFGSRPFTFEADVRRVAAPVVGEECALAAGEGVCVEGPAWLLPDPGVFTATLDRGTGSTRQVGVHVRPADGALFAEVDAARQMRLTGSMDALESGDCRVTDDQGLDLIPREEVVLRCRTRFVVTDAVPVE